ncbi:MAG: DUF6489 family protein [Hyphomonadaceae bacterium]
MKMRIEVECTPVEARQFMGLPDVTALNEALVTEMGKRLQANMSALSPEAMMRSWMQMGAQAQETFFSMLSAGARSGKAD